MLLLAKLAALGVIIWFYTTADKNAQPPVKWAIIGLIGYLISWFMADLIIDKVFASAMNARSAGTFVLGQLPTVVGLIGAHLVRKKLLSNMTASS